MEIGRPSVEHVTLGLRPCVTYNLWSSYFHVPLTTIRHLLTVVFDIRHLTGCQSNLTADIEQQIKCNISQ